MLDRNTPYFSYQNSFYGIKEPVTSSSDPTLTYATVGVKATSLIDVSSIEITNDATGKTLFQTTMDDIAAKSGWYRDFATDGERNLGQAAVLGGIVTFSTFLPVDDLCSPEGTSNLYALYYKTGTAYYEGVLLTTDYPGGVDTDDKVLYMTYAGKGYSTTPNIHTGAEEGSTTFLQTSTGAIKVVETKNTDPTTSGGVYWMERMED